MYFELDGVQLCVLKNEFIGIWGGLKAQPFCCDVKLHTLIINKKF